MAVIRRNFLTGNTSVLLSAGGTTLTSADLAALPVVAAPDYAWLSLDPLEEHGLPEIVKVTAHSSGAVTATIVRGQQTAEGGGPGREHPSGTFWAHPTTALDLADIDTAIGDEAAERATGDTIRVINTQTNDYTLVIADAGKVVEANKATAISVTVPPNASVGFPTGTIIEVNQVGAGLLTVVAGAGVTLNGTLTAPSRYGSLLLRKRATNEWTVTQVPAQSGTSVQGWLSVLSYGAIGDGVTDDTAAIQAALDAAADGQVVYFPPGRYSITTLTVTKQIELRGTGGWTIAAAAFGSAQYADPTKIGGSVLASTATSGVALTVAGVARTLQPVIRDLAIVGPGSGTSVGLDFGSATTSIARGRIERVLIANFATGCRWYCLDGLASALSIRGCTTGLAIQAGGMNNNVLVAFEAQVCVTGVSLDGHNNLFEAPLFQANTGKSVVLIGDGNHLNVPYFENSGGTGAIDGLAGADRNVVTGAHFGTAQDTAAFAGNSCAVLFPQADNGVTFTGGGCWAMGEFNAAVTGANPLLGAGAWDLSGAAHDFRIRSGSKFFFETAGTSSALYRESTGGFTVLGGPRNIYSGEGVPDNALGANGDLFFRHNGTVAAKTLLYHREAGVWVAVIP